MINRFAENFTARLERDRIFKNSLKSLLFAIFIVFSPVYGEAAQNRACSLLTTASNLSDPKSARQGARDEIVAMGAGAVPCLVDNLDTVDALKLRVVMDLLKQVGSPATPFLIEALQGDNPEIAYRAAMVMGDIPDKRAVKPLIAGLKSGDWRIRSACAKSLGALNGFESIGPLIEASHDSDEVVRRSAAVALGKTGDPLAVEPLLRLLKDPQFMVRYPAAQALSAIGKPAIPALKDTLQSEDPAVVIAALQALGGIPCDESARAAAKMLKHDDWAVRGVAVEALKRIDTISSKNALRKAARGEKNPFVLSQLKKPPPKN